VRRRPRCDCRWRPDDNLQHQWHFRPGGQLHIPIYPVTSRASRRGNIWRLRSNVQRQSSAPGVRTPRSSRRPPERHPLRGILVGAGAYNCRLASQWAALRHARFVQLRMRTQVFPGLRCESFEGTPLMRLPHPSHRNQSRHRVDSMVPPPLPGCALGLHRRIVTGRHVFQAGGVGPAAAPGAHNTAQSKPQIPLFCTQRDRQACPIAP
jgi:hypothetical protein